MKLTDTTFLFGELGRGSGKTSHILAPRLDRVQNDMPGSCLVLGASTYKSILDNIMAGLMEYLRDTYVRGIYYEIGTRPPQHFKQCATYIADYKHTVSFCNGTVVQFVSCDRPESMLGKNAAHLFIDEMLRIPKEKFTERIIPALRADRAKFGHSPYFMGITGFSSTPNFETDEDWFLDYEKNMDTEMIHCILEMAAELDLRIGELYSARENLDDETKIRRLEKFVERWEERINEFRRGQTFYMRASSFSNIKILGIDYIENQIKNIPDEDKLNTAILSVRKTKVKDRFFGKFGKEHLFDDSYTYKYIDTCSADTQIEQTSRNLLHCNPNSPLYFGYDPGPFSSVVVGQEKPDKREFRIIANFWVIHPEQQIEMAKKINDFFKHHRLKQIFLYYDRAANQQNPKYREYYEQTSDLNDSDATILKTELQKLGWNVQLMSLGQGTITYSRHYRLLNIIFSRTPDSRLEKVLIDKNECEALVSSINHSPLKRHEGKIMLDKSSERLEYKDQPFFSTQLASALMYLLWGRYKKHLPESERTQTQPDSGTYHP